MNDLFISEKNISLQKKSTTQVNAQCTLEIQLVQCLNLMTLEKYVAIPNTSEHQLGLSVDINADTDKCSSEKVYQWLDENAYKYGFVKRYPEDKTDITGISNEPWHYRYVGTTVAKIMKEENLCLEEYLEKYK